MTNFSENYQYRLQLILFLVFVFAGNFILYYVVGDSQYYWRPTDIQEDYFYGAMLLHNDFQILRPSHPGVPAYQILNLIFGLFGAPVESASDIFAASYAFVLVVSVACISVFAVVPKCVPASYRMLALSFLFVWPPTFFYSLTYGADSFVVPLSALIAGISWRFIDETENRPLWKWALFGALCGFSVTIKLTLMIPAAGAFLALASSAAFNRRSDRVIGPIAFGIGGVVAGVAFLYPAFWRIASYASMLLSPPNYLQTSAGIWSRITVFFGQITEYSEVLMGISLTMSCVAVIGVLTGIYVAWRFPEARSRLLPKAIFVIVMMVGLIKTMTGVANGGPSFAGVALRNSSAAIIAVPAGLLLLFEAYSKVLGEAKGLKLISALGVLFAVVITLYVTADNRADYADARQKLQTRWTDAIGQVMEPGQTVAVGEGANEAAFHFYGNNSYGGNRFDRQIAEAFPETTYVRRIEIARPPSIDDKLAVPRGRLSDLWQKIKGSWYRLFPVPTGLYPSELLVPAFSGRHIVGVVILRRELPRDCGISCFVELLRSQGHNVRFVGSRTIPLSPGDDLLVFSENPSEG